MSVAWAVPLLLSVFNLRKIPSVIVEIILGYLIGVIFFKSHNTDSFHILEFLALSGFVFLMFLSGLEIDVDQIVSSFPKRKTKAANLLDNSLITGILHFVFALLISYISTFLLSFIINIPHLWYFSLIMVTTSVGIVLPILKSRGELSTHFGQAIILAAAIADILSILLFTFTAYTIKFGFKWELLYIIGLFVLFIIFYNTGNRIKRIPVFKKFAFQLSHAVSQIRIRGVIVLILIFVVISQYIGEEVILLGAFLSGLIMSTLLHKERSALMIKLDGMGYGFFIPIFFIMVGVEFDPKALLEFDNSLIWFLLLLLVFMFLIKIVPSFLWKNKFGLKKSLAAGFLMSSRLSLIIAASAIGLDLGVITPGINSTFIIMAIITCFLSPVIFNAIFPDDKIKGMKTLIIGGSSTGVLLVRKLNLHGKRAVILEKDEKRHKEILKKGIVSVLGDGLDIDIYKKLNLKPSEYVVVDTGNDEQNIAISKLLRNDLSHENIISRADSLKIEKRLKALNVETVDVRRILATTYENLIYRPTTYHQLIESFENFSVEEIPVENVKIDGLHVKDIHFHQDAILMMIKRRETYYIPHGETIFQLGDILHVFGTDTAIEDTRRKVSKSVF
jgi:Kef-type K+ transport system membrane component KefB/Trk K+ transport system NAD-binding subunit